jgi:NADP-reducing hydrogenase subunit HndB
MKTITSPADLRKRRADILERMYGKEKTLIRVHMGTSGLASGAKEILDFLVLELEKRNIDADVVSTGDLGYSFAEPTIEVKLQQKDPVIFGNVDRMRADEIIEKYIKNGEYVDGILPANYRTIQL